MSAGSCRGQKRASDPLELHIDAVVSCVVGVLCALDLRDGPQPDGGVQWRLVISALTPESHPSCASHCSLNTVSLQIVQSNKPCDSFHDTSAGQLCGWHTRHSGASPFPSLIVSFCLPFSVEFCAHSSQLWAQSELLCVDF